MFLENHSFHNQYYKKRKTFCHWQKVLNNSENIKRFVCINQFLVVPQHISQAGLLTWLSAFHFAFPIIYQWLIHLYGNETPSLQRRVRAGFSPASLFIEPQFDTCHIIFTWCVYYSTNLFLIQETFLSFFLTDNFLCMDFSGLYLDFMQKNLWFIDKYPLLGFSSLFFGFHARKFIVYRQISSFWIFFALFGISCQNFILI